MGGLTELLLRFHNMDYLVSSVLSGELFISSYNRRRHSEITKMLDILNVTAHYLYGNFNLMKI